MDSAEMRLYCGRRKSREGGNPSPAKGTANPGNGPRKPGSADLGRLADGVAGDGTQGVAVKTRAEGRRPRLCASFAKLTPFPGGTLS